MLDMNPLLQWPGWSAFLYVFLFSCLLLLRTLRKSSPSSKNGIRDVEEPACYPAVEPLPDFEWRKTEPLKLRPFKPKYHLTMSIQESTASEIIEMDKNYLDRIMLRRRIMVQHPDTVLAAFDSVKPAVDEFYIWLVGTYLPTRFPRMFELQHFAQNTPGYLHNIVTNEHLPLYPADKPVDTLRTLGGLVEDDLLFLMPSDDGDGYTLKGFVTCFPNGFDTANKLGLKLRDIHIPVPHYKQTLEKSMDRFFDKLKVNKFIKRANWTITATDQLFTASGNHLYDGEDIPQERFDINTARIRTERQVVHRLPQTKAILFSFKTLHYTLLDIKEEGLGEALAEAIDGLKQGNAPGFYFYKRAAVWGEFAKNFLRS